MDDRVYFSFNKRYFVVGVLVYILSAYIALDIPVLSDFGAKLLLGYNIIFVILTLIVFLVFTGIFRENREMRAFSFSALAIILIFVLGFQYVSSFVKNMDRQVEILDRYPHIYGQVKSEPTLSSSGKSYGFTVETYIASDGRTSITFDKSCLVMMYLYKREGQTVPKVGDYISCETATSIEGKPAYEGGFDYSAYLRQKGIVYAGYTYKIEEFRDFKVKNPFASKLDMLGLKIRNKVVESTELKAYRDDMVGLLQGILVGVTDNMSDAVYNDLKASGLIHIASVSGMHTSYLFAALAFLLGILRLPKKAVCFIAIPIFIIFAAVSMFTPSVCRAVIMMIILLVANVIGRQNDSLTALAAAGLILGINNPYVLENYGMLLSFGATIGILVYYPLISKKLSVAIMKRPSSALSPRRLRAGMNLLYSTNKFAVDSICVALSAMIGLGYFMMRFFGYLQWGGMFAGLLAFGLVAVAFVGGYVNVLVFLISENAAELVAKFVINPALILIGRVAKMFSGRFFSIMTPYPTKVFFIIYIFICVVIYYMLKSGDAKK